MTRLELEAALRARFAGLRADFPAAVDAVRKMDGDALLESYARCGACGAFHVLPVDLVAAAACSADIFAWLIEVQELCRARFPAPCVARLVAIERGLSGKEMDV